MTPPRPAPPAPDHRAVPASDHRAVPAPDLAGMLGAAAAGRPPATDWGVDVLPRAAGGAVAAVVGFTAHHVVAADVDPGWVRQRLARSSGPAMPLAARFLAALADQLGAEPEALDAVLVGPAVAVPVPGLRPVGGTEHPRLRRAEHFRLDVRAYEVDGGLLVLGRGLAGRWEVAVEVEPAYRSRGLGRALVAAAPGLVPPGQPVWAQVAPGNVTSMRAFLAAGYRPVAAEVLLA